MAATGDNAESAFLQRHLDDYVSRFGKFYVLGGDVHEVPREMRLSRLLENDQDSEALKSPQKSRSSHAFRIVSPPVPESRITEKLLAVPQSRILLVGDGGIGKTECVRELVYQVACAINTDEPRSQSLRIPLYIDLASQVFVKQAIRFGLRQALGKIAASFNRTSTAREYFDYLIHSGSVILFLDGLDDIPRPRRKEFSESLIQEINAGRLRECSVVLASRPSALSLPLSKLFSPSSRFTPQLLTRDEIEFYIRNLFQEDQARSESLINGITNGPRTIKELLRRPLMLALTCALLEEGEVALPRSAVELMERTVRHLFQRSDIKDADAMFLVLESLAYGCLHKSGVLKHTHATSRIKLLKKTQDDVKDALRGFTPEQIIRRLLDKSGMIHGSLADGYYFTNKPIAEYLAGSYLARCSRNHIVRMLQHYAWRIEWEAPLFWMACHLWQHPRSRRFVHDLTFCLLNHFAQNLDDVSQTLLRLSESFLRACPSSVNAIDDNLITTYVSMLSHGHYLEIDARFYNKGADPWAHQVYLVRNSRRFSGLPRQLQRAVSSTLGSTLAQRLDHVEAILKRLPDDPKVDNSDEQHNGDRLDLYHYQEETYARIDVLWDAEEVTEDARGALIKWLSLTKHPQLQYYMENQDAGYRAYEEVARQMEWQNQGVSLPPGERAIAMAIHLSNRSKRNDAAGLAIQVVKELNKYIPHISNPDLIIEDIQRDFLPPLSRSTLHEATKYSERELAGIIDTGAMEELRTRDRSVFVNTIALLHFHVTRLASSSVNPKARDYRASKHAPDSIMYGDIPEVPIYFCVVVKRRQLHLANELVEHLISKSPDQVATATRTGSAGHRNIINVNANLLQQILQGENTDLQATLHKFYDTLTPKLQRALNWHLLLVADNHLDRDTVPKATHAKVVELLGELRETFEDPDDRRKLGIQNKEVTNVISLRRYCSAIYARAKDLKNASLVQFLFDIHLIKSLRPRRHPNRQRF